MPFTQDGGVSKDDGDAVDEDDFSVKIRVYTEENPDLPKIEGGAWWPIELLKRKPQDEDEEDDEEDEDEEDEGEDGEDDEAGGA